MEATGGQLQNRRAPLRPVGGCPKVLGSHAPGGPIVRAQSSIAGGYVCYRISGLVTSARKSKLPPEGETGDTHRVAQAVDDGVALRSLTPDAATRSMSWPAGSCAIRSNVCAWSGQEALL